LIETIRFKNEKRSVEKKNICSFEELVTWKWRKIFIF